MSTVKVRTLGLFIVMIFAGWASGDEFDEDLWNHATEFIVQYHSQWTLRRVVIIYHPYKGKENYMFEMAMNLFKRLSKVGVSSSFIRIPSPKAVQGLRLTEPRQPPIACILLLTPNAETSSFVKAAAESGGLSRDSIFWIHLRSGSTQRFLTQDTGLQPNTNLITAVIQSSGTANLFRWTGSQHLEKNTIWAGRGAQLPAELAEKPTVNLSGLKLSVAIFHDPPFVYAEKLTSNTVINNSMISGWMLDIWRDLQKALNFTSTFYIPARVDPTIGLFKRAVEELKYGRADVILLPFVVTLSDIDEAEFSAAVTDLKFRFLLPRVSAASSIDQFIEPFQLFLWRSTAVVLTFAVTFMTFAYILGRYYGFELEGMPIFQLKESIMIIYGALFTQSPEFTPNGYSARIILWSSFVFGLIVSQAYSAALISKLTLGTLAPPFDSLEGMLNTDYTTLFLPGSTIQRLVTTAEKGAWKELRERKPYPKVMTSVADAVGQVSNAWTLSAFLESRERILPVMNKAPFDCKTTLLPTNILKAPAQLMLSQSSPYKTALDQQLISMKASGRLARIRSSWMDLYFEEPCPKETTLAQFSMGNVILPFAILLGSVLVGLVLMLVEYFIKKWFGRLLNDKFDDRSELQAIARRRGVRLTKGWKIVQSNMPIKT